MTPQEIEALKSERDELAAKVEFLRSSIDKYQALGDECILREALTKTTQRCLRDVQADAVKRFVEFNAGRYTNHFDFCLSDALETYLAWSQT